MRPILERCAEVGATVAREGREFGVLRRAVAVGGQVLTLQGLGGVYEDIFLPLHGAHQAQNAAVALAAVEAFFGAGDEPAARHRRRPGRLRRGQLARPAGAGAQRADDPASTRRTTRTGWRPRSPRCSEEFAFSRLVGVVAVLADKDVGGMLELLEPVLDEIVVTRNTSPRAMPADELAALAVEVFGEDRVHGRPTDARRDRGGGGRWPSPTSPASWPGSAC